MLFVLKYGFREGVVILVFHTTNYQVFYIITVSLYPGITTARFKLKKIGGT